MTQKEELEQAQTKITELQTKVDASAGLQEKLDTASTNLSAAEKARDDEKARADKAEQSLAEEKTRATKAETDLATAKTSLTAAEKARDDEKARADKAEKAVADADQTHAEQLAGRNIKPVRKAAAVDKIEDAFPTGKTSAQQIKEQYAAIEDREERHAFFQKHKAVLMA